MIVYDPFRHFKDQKWSETLNSLNVHKVQNEWPETFEKSRSRFKTERTTANKIKVTESNSVRCEYGKMLW